MLRFMLSQASIERRSAILFSTSCGSKVGIAMPGSGTPSGPHSRRNISNGSWGGVLSLAIGPFVRRVEELAHLRLSADGVLVAEVDERAAERFLEQEVAREVRARAVERAGRLEEEAHRRRQLVQEARGDALDRLRGCDEQHLDRPQSDAGVAEALRRDQLDGAVDALHALDVDRQAVEEDRVERVAGDLRERRIDARARAVLVLRLPPGADDQHAVG